MLAYQVIFFFYVFFSSKSHGTAMQCKKGRYKIYEKLITRLTHLMIHLWRTGIVMQRFTRESQQGLRDDPRNGCEIQTLYLIMFP